MVIGVARRLAVIGGLLAALALSTGELRAQSAGKPFRVVTTFTVMQDIAQNVAGEAAIVESMTKPGADHAAAEWDRRGYFQAASVP